MTLDITVAFDNVSHEAIMEGLNNANCGKRIHDYVRAFLTKRTATVGLGDLRSDVCTTLRKGPPQDSVISPILFNIAMIGLARRLSKIDGIEHAIYADDITVWVNRDSLGQKQEKLQEAAKCVEEYVRERGLACSTKKSQILRVGRNPTMEELIVKLEGQSIPEGSMMRILGIWIQGSKKCSHTIRLLKKSTEQVRRTITRVAQRRSGMREGDTIKLVRSLVVSRVTYSFPYHNMTKPEKEQTETILRKAYKTVLHLPRNTSNDKLPQMRLSNAFEELAEAQLNVQIARLQKSATSRKLLKRMGHNTDGIGDWAAPYR
nr:uncharacterized protein LOC126522128 [Dermacentor andersoni]